jgi:XTP/dITP diphosphohydrolase
MQLLIATANLGKLREIGDLLEAISVSVCGLGDAGITDRIAESGQTFAENAELKAAGYALTAGLPALADDSGLAIDFLNGAPGIRSARWAGDGATDQARIETVLSQMRAARANQRSARFICAVAGNILCRAEGICEGTIADAPRGANGFGYDPIFVPLGHELTFGELSTDIKRHISHRAQAIAKIIPFLQGFFGV